MEQICAACYIRVSTEEQTEYSPEAQRRALDRYAQQHNMTILPEHVYIDAGISGRRAETRPAFMSMIAAAKLKPPPFSAILVHKFDRFARNREDSIIYKSMLRRQCGVQVISITEHLEDDRMSLILEAMLEAMAEYYSINLGDEVRKGMTEKARRGELQTVPPFGYRVRDNTLVPIPQEAAAIQEIFRQFLAGSSMIAIARWTQRLGILTHRGNPMDARQIKYILGNPVYIGMLRWRPAKGEPDAPPLIVPSGHPPLISQETFDAAGLLLQTNAHRHGKHARPAGERKHWLAGLVRCAQCGGGLIFSQPHYLKCGRYAKGRCTASQHTPVKPLEEAILAQLRADAACQCDFSIDVSPSSHSQAALSQELAVTEKKLQRLREAFLCGAESLEKYKAAKLALTEQADRLRHAIQSGQEPAGKDTALLRARIQDALLSLGDPEAGTEEKYRAASCVLERCTWSKGDKRITILYRLAL